MKQIDYENNIVGVPNSILKYFGINALNKSDSVIDDYLDSYDAKNIIVILCDGLGFNFLNSTLNTDSFLLRNLAKSITSVFPTTTVAATTSIITGLYPNQHCWLGWDNYILEIDKVVSMFLNKEKDTDNYFDTPDFCKKIFPYKTIFETINKTGKAKAYFISPYGDIKYDSFEDLCENIIKISSEEGKKFIYAYYENPDSLMHKYGLRSIKVLDNVIMINNQLELLSEKLQDSLLIITADHGLTENKYIYIEDDKELFDCLLHTTSIDSRASMLFLKPNYKSKFLEIFKDRYAKHFILMSKQEILNKCLFGIGINHQKFESCLGDYIAISISNISLKYLHKGHNVLANHSGLTEDEVDVPLILVKTKK